MGTAFKRCPSFASSRCPYLPAMPTLLPTPVTKSQPVFAVKLPAFPDVTSRKSALEQVLAGPMPQTL